MLALNLSLGFIWHLLVLAYLPAETVNNLSFTIPFIPLNLQASIISHLSYLFSRVKFYLPSSYSLFRSYPTSLMLLLNALLPALNLLLLHPLKWGDQKYHQYWRYKATLDEYNGFFSVLFSTPFLKNLWQLISFSEFLKPEILFHSCSGQFGAHNCVCEVRTTRSHMYCLSFTYTDFTFYCIATESLNPTVSLHRSPLSLPTWIIMLNQKTVTSCFISFHSLLWMSWKMKSQPSGLYGDIPSLWISTKLLFPSASPSPRRRTDCSFCVVQGDNLISHQGNTIIFLSGEQYRNYINLQINFFCMHSFYTLIHYF